MDIKMLQAISEKIKFADTVNPDVQADMLASFDNTVFNLPVEKQRALASTAIAVIRIESSGLLRCLGPDGKLVGQGALEASEFDLPDR